jgi:hypothetical protein
VLVEQRFGENGGVVARSFRPTTGVSRAARCEAALRGEDSEMAVIDMAALSNKDGTYCMNDLIGQMQNTI